MLATPPTSPIGTMPPGTNLLCVLYVVVVLVVVPQVVVQGSGMGRVRVPGSPPRIFLFFFYFLSFNKVLDLHMKQCHTGIAPVV